jgi:hypothetical protein
VDSSSGAIGSAVNRAIEELVSVIAKAPVDLVRRAKWLERLWDAYVTDAIPYIETPGDFWGELCVRNSPRPGLTVLSNPCARIGEIIGRVRTSRERRFLVVARGS